MCGRGRLSTDSGGHGCRRGRKICGRGHKNVRVHTSLPITIVVLSVNHSIIDIHSCIITGLLPRSADLRFGLVTLAYENAENHYHWWSISPKIDPCHMYGHFKKLTGSPVKDCRVQTNGSHCHVCYCTYQLCKRQSADTNVLICRFWLSAKRLIIGRYRLLADSVHLYFYLHPFYIKSIKQLNSE